MIDYNGRKYKLVSNGICISDDESHLLIADKLIDNWYVQLPKDWKYQTIRFTTYTGMLGTITGKGKICKIGW